MGFRGFFFFFAARAVRLNGTSMELSVGTGIGQLKIDGLLITKYCTCPGRGERENCEVSDEEEEEEEVTINPTGRSEAALHLCQVFY